VVKWSRVPPTWQVASSILATCHVGGTFHILFTKFFDIGTTIYNYTYKQIGFKNLKAINNW
jgi:hypothetical protein